MTFSGGRIVLDTEHVFNRACLELNETKNPLDKVIGYILLFNKPQLSDILRRAPVIPEHS